MFKVEINLSNQSDDYEKKLIELLKEVIKNLEEGKTKGVLEEYEGINRGKFGSNF